MWAAGPSMSQEIHYHRKSTEWVLVFLWNWRGEGKQWGRESSRLVDFRTPAYLESGLYAVARNSLFYTLLTYNLAKGFLPF